MDAHSHHLSSTLKTLDGAVRGDKEVKSLWERKEQNCLKPQIV